MSHKTQHFLFSLVFSVLLILPAASFSQPSQKIKNALDSATLFKETLEYDKAISILENAAKKEKSGDLEKMLGKLYYLNGDSDKALAILKEVKDKNWWVYVYLGLSYEDLDQLNLAIQSYLKSINLDKNSLALYRLGKIYYQQRKYNNASKYFLDLISLDPSMRLSYYYLGESLLRLAKYEESYRYLAKAINFYPGNEKIKHSLADVKKRLGEEFFVARRQKLEKERKEKELGSYKREEAIPIVKVGIGTDLRKIILRSEGRFIFDDGKRVIAAKANEFYTILLKNNKFIIYDSNGNIVAEDIDSPLQIKGKDRPFYILDLIYGKRTFWHKQIDMAYRGELKLVAKKGTITLINILSIEEYLYGVLSAEMLANSDPEALKTQAVVARTLAFKNIGRHKSEGFDFCADIHCQVYHGVSAETRATTKAVKDTRGQVLFYNDEPIEALYYANCGGCFRDDAFGKKDYLVTKFDSIDEVTIKSPYQEEQWFFDDPTDFFCHWKKGSFRWQRIYDAQDFAFIFGFKLRELERIFPLEKGDCFHYKKIEVVSPLGALILSKDLAIREYFDYLRSTAFKFEVQLSNNEPSLLLFWGAGFGHGTGLCQEGAMEMANQGYDYKEILKHYYPTAKIKRAY